MQWLVIAVAGNCKHSGFKQQKLFSYSSGGQKSELRLPRLRLRCWQSCVPSGGSKENPSLPMVSQGLQGLLPVCFSNLASL